MYIIFDLTVGTLADLVGFTGYLNTSTTFSLYEHDAEWKTAVTYPDFTFNNVWDPQCELPAFWDDDGGPVVIQLTGCYASYGLLFMLH
jgi:alpha-1,3-glucan synthase